MQCWSSLGLKTVCGALYRVVCGLVLAEYLVGLMMHLCVGM